MRKRILFLLILCIICIIVTDSSGQETWSFPITVSIDQTLFRLQAGVSPSATPGYDRSLDELTAPPPRIAPYCFFSIPEFPHFLRTSYVPPSDPAVWNLIVMDTKGEEIGLKWDLSGIPSALLDKKQLWINQKIDMTKQDSYSFQGDANIRIAFGTHVRRNPARYFGSVSGYADTSRVTLRIWLIDSMRVSVEIYSQDFRMIRRWISKSGKVEAFSLNWDGRDDLRNRMPCGVYLCRVRGETGECWSKFLLMR